VRKNGYPPPFEECKPIPFTDGFYPPSRSSHDEGSCCMIVKGSLNHPPKTHPQNKKRRSVFLVCFFFPPQTPLYLIQVPGFLRYLDREGPLALPVSQVLEDLSDLTGSRSPSLLVLPSPPPQSYCWDIFLDVCNCEP